MSVTAFPLSHGGVESTAFLIESDGDAVLCFGDTGPDAVEKGTRLRDVWTAVAERVRQKRLKAIVIESSYTSDRPDNLLFGHLTPRYVLEALRELDKQAGGNALKGLPVVVEPHQVLVDQGAAAETDVAGVGGRQRPGRALRHSRAGKPLAFQVIA